MVLFACNKSFLVKYLFLELIEDQWKCSHSHTWQQKSNYFSIKGNQQYSNISSNWNLYFNCRNINILLQKCGLWRHLVVVCTNCSFLLVILLLRLLCNENEFFNLVYNKLCRYFDVFLFLMLPAFSMHLSEPNLIKQTRLCETTFWLFVYVKGSCGCKWRRKQHILLKVSNQIY